MDSLVFILVLSTLRLSLPILFAATGGYFSEKSGVAQIALEAFLMIGAFTAATAMALLTPNGQPVNFGFLLLCYLLAGLSALLLAQLFNWLVIVFKSNSIVIGTGLNLFVMGIIPIISKTLFNSTGSTPSLNLASQLGSSFSWWPYLLFAFIFFISYLLSEKTLWGLQMKFAGEKTQALTAAGVSVSSRRWQSVSWGAFVAGLGGAVLSTYLASAYSPMMSAGRGYIALAALIFAGWNLPKALLVSLFFGFCEALQIQVQARPELALWLPLEFIQMTPYIATLIILLIFKNTKNAPAELS